MLAARHCAATPRFCGGAAGGWDGLIAAEGAGTRCGRSAAGSGSSRRARTPARGLATKDPETAQVAGILPFFILMFASDAIVPVSTMPSWLQGFARNQPLSVTISAVRALLEGSPAGHWIWQSLAWSAGIVVVFFVLALHLYRNATA